MGDKLFKPEDFDKNPKETKVSHRVALLTALILVVMLVVIAFMYWNKTDAYNEGTVDGQAVEKYSQSGDNLMEIDEVSSQKNTISDSNKVAVEESKEPQVVNTENVKNNVSYEKETGVSVSVEEKARQVIRGGYGNGNIRKQKLGEEYSEIQSAVNEMYRKGLVK